jgi:hypothetical protein
MDEWFMLSIVNSTPFRNHVLHLHYLEASIIVIYYVSLQEKLSPIKKMDKKCKSKLVGWVLHLKVCSSMLKIE